MARIAGSNRNYTLALVDHNGKVTEHTYDFPSVTSILDAVVAKPKLMHWYYAQAIKGAGELIQKYGGKLPYDPTSLKQLMAQEGHSPYSKRNAAAKRGTGIHKDLEVLCAGGNVQATPENLGMLNWWTDKGLSPEDVIAAEVPLISFNHRYAGTVDLIYRDPTDSKLVLTDLKTGNYLHWTHFVQGEAYREAWNETNQENVHIVSVVHAPPIPEDKFIAAAAQAAGSSPLRGYTEKVARDIDFSVFENILNIYRWLPDDWMPEDIDEALNA